MRLLMVFGILSILLLSVGCGQDTAGKKELDLILPEKAMVARGSEADVVVKIQRHNFELPVKVKMSNFPDGVTVKDSEQNEVIYAADDDEMPFTVTADATSETGEHTVTVTADVEEMSPVTEEFTLVVTE